MNRLCIYVTYNKQNRIEAYVGYMLKAFRNHVTTLYVVCNYPKILDGIEYVEPYADDIFYRENKGYDAGAYKDMLCTILGWDKVYQYDELILMNDSFLGPFYDLDRYFTIMEQQNCDFWGMTRSPAGEYKDVKYKFDSHIQSYFIVFRSTIITSNVFKDFWEKFICPVKFIDAIIDFEVTLNITLKKNGFISSSLTDTWGMTFPKDVNPILHCVPDLIRDQGFPILKKKALLIRNAGFADVLKAVEFIDIQKLYPADWIWKMIDSQFYIEHYAPDGMNCLEFFYNKFSKIYIYGAGVCGKNLVLYFEHKRWKQDGILVSDIAGQDTECTLFDDACIDDETGIIISVIHEDVSKEIIQYIEANSTCKREQMFVIYDCKAIRLPE